MSRRAFPRLAFEPFGNSQLSAHLKTKQMNAQPHMHQNKGLFTQVGGAPHGLSSLCKKLPLKKRTKISLRNQDGRESSLLTKALESRELQAL